MGIIIPIPTFVDPDNPTADETAADTLYKTRMQVTRDIVSPDITNRFTDEMIPDSIISEAGALLICERQVMDDSGYDAAQIQALVAGSSELVSLVFATECRRAIQLLPQAAQMVREGLLGDTRQFQEVDWEEREKRIESDYQDAIRVVNPDAIFDPRGGSVDVTVETTKSRALRSDY